MWVNSYVWNEGASNLHKFFVERIIQRCDYGEVISNKHRTVNGYTQVKELIKLTELSQKRERTVKTLGVLIEESRTESITQNIVNDLIINKYFVDLKNYVKALNIESLGSASQPNLSKLRVLYHDLKKHETQLDYHYFNLLKTEISNIDFYSEFEFETNADLISKLIDILIPYLVFKGYSISSMSGVLVKWMKRQYRPVPNRFLNYFSFKKKSFQFIINLQQENDESSDFSKLLLHHYPNYTIEKGSEADLKKFGFDDNHIIAKFSCESIDPHSHIRDRYDTLLKQILIHKERASLHAFNNFFDHCYWRMNSGHSYQKINTDFDPININARISTLRNTLFNSRLEYKYEFEKDSHLPMPKKSETLKKAIYYYNIALGSKSIENSLSLLWTSLETILPYRLGSSDIECIQNFVAKSLCIGAYARDIHSYALRFIMSNLRNNNELTNLGTRGFSNYYTKGGQWEWYKWLCDDTDKDHRLISLKSISELLAYTYVKLGRPLSQGKLDYLYTRLKSSENSIRFQLQRIYLHRNQIVHAGDLVNEYTNLWLHLEWYVGKLLAFALIHQDFLNSTLNIGDLFREVESDYDYVMSYLKMNKNKKIRDSDRIMLLLFNHSWQSY